MKNKMCVCVCMYHGGFITFAEHNFQKSHSASVTGLVKRILSSVSLKRYGAQMTELSLV